MIWRKTARHFALLLVVLGTALTTLACGEKTGTPVNTTVPIASPTPALSLTPTPMTTPTVMPTLTAVPTATPVPTPTRTPLPIPVPTPLPGAGFIFTAAGDYGSNADTTASLEGIAHARSGASFNLALGDLSYSKDPESQWCEYVKSKVGATFPFQLVAGNHEDDNGGDGHINNFAVCLPDKISGGVTGDYAKQYYFDYQGLARFIMISPDLTIGGQYYHYDNPSDRYNWVAAAIEGAARANIPWVIVGMHKTCLSMGRYSCDIGTDLMNLLIQKKVDLVLQAHDHTYQRSKQLGLSPSCTTVVPRSFNGNCVVDGGEDNAYTGVGTVFMIIGSPGGDVRENRELYDINTADPEAGYFAKWMGANSTPTNGFMKFTVSNSEIRAEFIPSGTNSGFTDDFVIKKPG